MLAFCPFLFQLFFFKEIKHARASRSPPVFGSVFVWGDGPHGPRAPSPSTFKSVHFRSAPGYPLALLLAAWALMAGEVWLVSYSCSEIRRFLSWGLYSAESSGSRPESGFSLHKIGQSHLRGNMKCTRQQRGVSEGNRK